MNELIEKTRTYLKHAYTPYSNFKVAACVKTKDHEYYGVNIENASYGLTNCAERSALFNAYSQGVHKDDIIEMVLVTPTKTLTYPCGACRQVMVELLNKDVKLTIASDSQTKVITVADLLPFAFDASDLIEK